MNSADSTVDTVVVAAATPANVPHPAFSAPIPPPAYVAAPVPPAIQVATDPATHSYNDQNSVVLEVQQHHVFNDMVRFFRRDNILATNLKFKMVMVHH